MDKDKGKAKETRAEAVGEVPVISPRAVYSPGQIQKLLGLRRTSIYTEIKKRRLQRSLRCGKVFILGAWVIRWLEEGRVSRTPRGCTDHTAHDEAA